MAGHMLTAMDMTGQRTGHAPTAGLYPDDPLASPMWEAHAKTLFGSDPVRFDTRLRVTYPQIAENQHVFPVAVDARGIGSIRRLVILADLNPIPFAVDYQPLAAAPYIATCIKLDQRTPVRGAAQMADGQWLVNGGWVDAAGGGCSAPPSSRIRGDWAEHLGEMRGGAWPTQEGATALLRVLVRHPMDTGFVANIPTYNLEKMVIESPSGAPLGSMDLTAAISEDPEITLMPHAAAGDVLAIDALDSNGRAYRATVTVGAAL